MAHDGLRDIPVTREGPPPRAKGGLYRDLILSAWFFAERARECEDRALADAEASGRVRTPYLVRHRSYVTGAVLSAAAFLEASINELYTELHTRGERAPLPRRVLAVLTRFWTDIERAPVLHRYQTVLMVADAERFDERRAPYFEADTLLRLRDALVHCRPERADNRRRLRSLESRLRDRWPDNPLATADAAWFPERCLSAACAQWAFHAADSFSADFCRRMALPARSLEWSEPDVRHGTSVTARSLIVSSGPFRRLELPDDRTRSAS